MRGYKRARVHLEACAAELAETAYARGDEGAEARSAFLDALAKTEPRDENEVALRRALRRAGRRQDMPPAFDLWRAGRVAEERLRVGGRNFVLVRASGGFALERRMPSWRALECAGSYRREAAAEAREKLAHARVAAAYSRFPGVIRFQG